MKHLVNYQCEVDKGKLTAVAKFEKLSLFCIKNRSARRTCVAYDYCNALPTVQCVLNMLLDVEINII